MCIHLYICISIDLFWFIFYVINWFGAFNLFFAPRLIYSLLWFQLFMLRYNSSCVYIGVSICLFAFLLRIWSKMFLFLWIFALISLICWLYMCERVLWVLTCVVVSRFRLDFLCKLFRFHWESTDLDPVCFEKQHIRVMAVNGDVFSLKRCYILIITYGLCLCCFSKGLAFNLSENLELQDYIKMPWCAKCVRFVVFFRVIL